MIEWTLLHPNMTPEALGYLPGFLSEEDLRGMRDQIDERYVSGWSAMPGWDFDTETWILTYPGDRPLYPLAVASLRHELPLYYRHSWVVVLDMSTGSHEVARLD